jgi:hypothetical protein
LAPADDDGLDLLDHETERRLPAWGGASVNPLILILRAWSDLTMPSRASVLPQEGATDVH